jgi:large subunit ribosomal protein L19e
MQITNQKKMAAQILSVMEGREVGVHRVWINPSYLDQVAQSVQKEDIREAIDNGWIKAKAIKGTSRVRALKRQEQKKKGRQKGQGMRSGSANARNPSKQQWMATIRAQRRALKGMREDGTLKSSQYRHYYLKAKGGSYRSIGHMKAQMGVEGITIGGEQ